MFAGIYPKFPRHPNLSRNRWAYPLDHSTLGVDDEGDVDEARPFCDVVEVRHSQHVRRLDAELPVDVIERHGVALSGTVVRTRLP